MKVLLLNLWRIIDSKGGTEKVFFSMANELNRRGINVVAVGFENKVGEVWGFVKEIMIML